MDPRLKEKLPTLRKTFFNWRFVLKHYEMLPVYFYIVLGWSLAIGFSFRTLFYHPNVYLSKRDVNRLETYRHKHYSLYSYFRDFGEVKCYAPIYEFTEEELAAQQKK